MNQTGKKGPDVIGELIEDCLLAFPVSSLLISLYKQYGQRGFLTKKQMQGLYAKAAQVPGMAPARLATLEAMIRRLPNRVKSSLPENKPLYVKDPLIGDLLENFLSRYPGHKRVVFLKSKFDQDQPLTAAETDELKRFAKLLLK